MADQRISALTEKTTVHDTDLFPIVDIEATPDETKKITGANLRSQILQTNIIDKTHLSQDFGASSARLLNLIPTPIAGYALWISNACKSNFSAKINGNPTSTSVIYDGETNENMFNGLFAYNGDSYWGQIILHNTTRGNSRKIISVNIATNTITTTASTDNWADNDDITTNSQTCAVGSFFDVDLSTKIAATKPVVIFEIGCTDLEGTPDADRYIQLNPYEAYDAGKSRGLGFTLSNELSVGEITLTIISQTVAVRLASGCEAVRFIMRVPMTYEYADT